MPFEFRTYETPRGDSPFERWMDSIRDDRTSARIKLRLDRVAAGNLGDHRTVGDGVWEMRLDFGPGYRIYFAFEQDRIILLYAGGHKGTQFRDIARAKEYHRDHQARQASRDPQLG
jgi:putative addiction module killer protein